MKSIVAYVRSLLGWCEEDLQYSRTSFKRDRADDDLSSDDDTPALKRLKQLRKTNFPDMSTNDLWDKRKKNVRYVPIQLEHGHPSTSTPKDSSARQGNKVRTVPIKFVDIMENGPATPSPKPRIHTPVRPVIHAVIDDDDDEEQEVTLVENKSSNVKKPTKVYIELDDDDDEHHQQEEDVIFVKKVTTPSPVKPYKFFVTKNNTDNSNSRVNKYYTIGQRISNRNTENTLPRNYNKFKTPAGITKTYKKQSAPIMSWIQTAKPNLSPLRKKYLNVNGNARSTLTEVFNLDEKRNYQELIRRVAGTTKPVSLRKPVDIIDLAEESASFRSTQKAQKNALNEIRLVEKGLKAYEETEESKEYDPITVASINSSDSEVEIVPSESSTTSSFRIDPVNTLRDSYKDRPVTSSDWLTKLDSKYRKKKKDTQDKLKDARLENDIIAKVNHEQKIAHLEHKLKYELSIPESLIVEAEPAAEFPELTPEQEKLVNRALGPGPPGQLLIEKFNLRIHRRDLQTLADLNWLNDEVINFYMNLLMQRSEQRKDLPRAYATNTFFYPKLMQAGQAGLRRWTRKVDIFSYELMIVPVHLGVHWCMSVIDFAEKRIKYFDSMGARNQACVEALLQYLRDEHKDKKGSAFDDSGWRTECVKDIPQQMNGSDCGVFALTFGEFSCRRAPFAFSQQHMPYLRRKAALEVLSGQLLL